MGIINTSQRGSLAMICAGGRDTFLEGEIVELRVILKTAMGMDATQLEVRAQEFVAVDASRWVAIGKPYALTQLSVAGVAESETTWRFRLRTALIKPTRYELQAVAPAARLVSNSWTVDIVSADPLTHSLIFERDSSR